MSEKKSGFPWIASIVLAALVVTTGCFSTGKPFETETVKSIENGKTTKNELLNMFGAPHAKGIENGMETWTYTHYKFRLIGLEEWAKDLIVRFSEDGVVKSYSYSSSWPPGY